MRQERFEFTNAGDAIVGDLYLPDQAPKGVVVTTGPLTSVKEQAAGAYAKAMAERGYAALAFDQRTFGESGGEPRQLENPQGKATTSSVRRPPLASGWATRSLCLLWGSARVADTWLRQSRVEPDFARLPASQECIRAQSRPGLGSATTMIRR
jgi:hypothetical protein